MSKFNWTLRDLVTEDKTKMLDCLCKFFQLKQIKCLFSFFGDCVCACMDLHLCVKVCRYLVTKFIQPGQAWGVVVAQYSKDCCTSQEKLPIDWLHQQGEICTVSCSSHWSWWAHSLVATAQDQRMKVWFYVDVLMNRLRLGNTKLPCSTCISCVSYLHVVQNSFFFF